jgi:hypothetical protein
MTDGSGVFRHDQLGWEMLGRRRSPSSYRPSSMAQSVSQVSNASRDTSMPKYEFSKEREWAALACCCFSVEKIYFRVHQCPHATTTPYTPTMEGMWYCDEFYDYEWCSTWSEQSFKLFMAFLLLAVISTLLVCLIELYYYLWLCKSCHTFDCLTCLKNTPKKYECSCKFGILLVIG